MRNFLLSTFFIPTLSVFTPSSREKMKVAVDECLNQNSTGNCIILEISDVESGQGSGEYGSMDNWDVSRVTDMREMFKNTEYFDQDLSKWDVSRVTNMEEMFFEASSFISDISEWDVSRVNYMNSTFYNAKKFNSDLSKWDVSNVQSLRKTFQFAGLFNSDLSKWDVSKNNNMLLTFGDCAAFNSDISNWDVSKVTSLYATFVNAKKFNSDISKWDVSRVTRLDETFKGASVFNQDLSQWNISATADINNLFTSSGLQQTNYPCSAKWYVHSSDIPELSTCVGCTTLGHYGFPASLQCVECPRGYYQDEPHKSTCKICPPTKWTSTGGNEYDSDCQDINSLLDACPSTKEQLKQSYNLLNC